MLRRSGYCLLLAPILAALLAGIPAAMAEALQVSAIEVAGLERTQRITVLRELPFHVGSSWQPDYAELSERRLRNLGIFSQVAVSAPDEAGVVRISIGERWSLWILPQASRKDNGVSSLSMVVDDYNMWGLNHHLRMAYKRDTGKNFTGLNGTSYESSYLWQRVGDSRLSLAVSGSWGYSIYDTYDMGVNTAQYQLRGTNGSARLIYALDDVPGEGWSVSGGVNGSNSKYRFISGTPQGDVIGHRIRAITMGASYEGVDDHLTWMTGSSFTYNFSVAHRGLGSTLNSYTHEANWSDYYAFSGQHTFNIRLSGGVKTGELLRSGLFDIGNRNGLRGYYPGELQGTNYMALD